jgi:hypothetical protein
MPEGDTPRGRIPVELAVLIGVIILGLIAIVLKVAGVF